MKKLAALALVAIATCFAFTLSACGEDYSKNFQGEWTAIEVAAVDQSDEEAVETASMFNLVMNVGMSIDLNLNEDGTCEMIVASQTTTGTWKAQSATECEIVIDDAQAEKVTLEGDNLVILDSNVEMTFARK